MPEVLVVDEDRSVVNALSRLFNHENIKHLCFDNPQEGITCLQSQSDILVLIADHVGLNTNNSNLLTYVRQHRPDVKVVILTGYIDTQMLQRIINEDLADRLLFKPWRNEELLEVVQQQQRLATEQKRTTLTVTSVEDKAEKLKAEVIERDRLLNMCLSTQHRYEQVIEQLPLGCVALSNEGLIIVANAQARELLNIEQGAVGLVVDQVLSPFLLASLDKASNEGSDIEWRNLRIQTHDLNDDRGRFGRILVIDEDANDDS